MMPSILWMMGVLLRVQTHTFLVEMMCMMSYHIIMWARLGEKGCVGACCVSSRHRGHRR